MGLQHPPRTLPRVSCSLDILYTCQARNSEPPLGFIFLHYLEITTGTTGSRSSHSISVFLIMRVTFPSSFPRNGFLSCTTTTSLPLYCSLLPLDSLKPTTLNHPTVLWLQTMHQVYGAAPCLSMGLQQPIVHFTMKTKG